MQQFPNSTTVHLYSRFRLPSVVRHRCRGNSKDRFQSCSTQKIGTGRNRHRRTEDRRKELTKTVAKKSEDCKVVIRGIRRDEIEKYKAMKKKSEITEDDLKNIEKEIQDIIDAQIKEIDKIAEKKNKEIMEI